MCVCVRERWSLNVCVEGVCMRACVCVCVCVCVRERDGVLVCVWEGARAHVCVCRGVLFADVI